ncbi:nickel/cobalt efflux protein RcnA [Erwinia sp. V71]|uniref:nickel/cobalt efflux protein RcnA n=1 Tax=Erwinia sp. V71 TaxID=3369424 RepID=UPI003F5DB479
MNDFTSLLQQGNAWFFVPSAILLGALHGLEPGHSKTMMAAFIIAIKGTVRQAVMLGLAATVSHTAIVWLIALGGMLISQRFTAAVAEPWLQMISAVIILATAGWMFWRTWQGERGWLAEHSHHGHTHDHEHHHHDHAHSHKYHHEHEHEHEHEHHHQQSDEHVHTHDHPHTSAHRHHDHQHADTSPEYQDAHERAHAQDIQRRFTTDKVSNGQILLFGLTGGLIPCPAAITVLLICLQLKALALGATMVVSFSIGLALTMVTVGVAAAVSVQQAAKRWPGFNTIARCAPYLSSLLIALVGIYMGIHGYHGISGQAG